MLRLGIALLVGAFFCFMAGAKGCSDSMKFQKPVTITAQDFMKKHPTEGWYRVTGATMILMEAKYMVTKSKYSTSSDDEDVSKANTIYLPVHAGADLGSKSMLVLKSNDPTLKATLADIDRQTASLNDAQFDAWLDQNKSRIFLQKDITGMVAAGIDDNSSDKAEIAKLGEELGPNFCILNEGQKPTPPAQSFGMVIGGVVLALLGLASIVGRLFSFGRSS